MHEFLTKVPISSSKRENLTPRHIIWTFFCKLADRTLHLTEKLAQFDAVEIHNHLVVDLSVGSQIGTSPAWKPGQHFCPVVNPGRAW